MRTAKIKDLLRGAEAGEGALGIVGLGKQSLFIVRASDPVTQLDNCWHHWKPCGVVDACKEQRGHWPLLQLHHIDGVRGARWLVTGDGGRFFMYVDWIGISFGRPGESGTFRSLHITGKVH